MRNTTIARKFALHVMSSAGHPVTVAFAQGHGHPGMRLFVILLTWGSALATTTSAQPMLRPANMVRRLQGLPIGIARAAQDMVGQCVKDGLQDPMSVSIITEKSAHPASVIQRLRGGGDSKSSTTTNDALMHLAKTLRMLSIIWSLVAIYMYSKSPDLFWVVFPLVFWLA